MIQISSRNAPLPYSWEINTILITVPLPFVLTYLVTIWRATPVTKGNVVKFGRPPTLPYLIPWLGHVINFLSGGGRVLASGVDHFGPHVPFRLVLGPSRMFIMSIAELVAALCKATKEISGNRGTILAMEYAFGAPRKSLEFYEADDSGMLANPIPNSKTKPEDRIFYSTHKVITTLLSGPILTPVTTRFHQSLVKKVSELDHIGTKWVEIPDFYGFLRGHILKAAVRAVKGENILSLNPTFAQDNWEYDHSMRGLFMRTPRWLSPGIYRTRDEMLENMNKWHRHALEHYDLSTVPGDVEWEPYWCTRFERYRQANFHRWTALDETARAAEDLGTLWALDAPRDPHLPDPRVPRPAELTASRIPRTSSSDCNDDTIPTYDAVGLCASPLLQSIYAETLYLRGAIMGTRLVAAPNALALPAGFRLALPVL